jgi:hypothetical protein
MVAHQTVGMHLPGGFEARFREGFQEIVAIGVVQEDIFSSIAPAHDVVDRARILNPRFAWHEGDTSVFNGAVKPNVAILRTDPFSFFRQGKPAYGPGSLSDQLARKREDRRDDEGRCVDESYGNGTNAFIEFVTADDRVHGFAYSQLMNYTLEKISENEHKADAPQDRLQLFSPRMT